MRGSAVAAAVAFLVATPELEIAAILLTLGLAASATPRNLIAAAVALVVGLLLYRFRRKS